MAWEPGLVRGAVSRAERDATPDDGRRYELVDGLLIVGASPGLAHQRALARLVMVLSEACPDDLEVMPGPFDVPLAEDTVLVPDVVVGHQAAFTEHDLPEPMLVVEIVTPATALIDRHVKKSRLERAAVASYWLVDPDVPRLIAWELGDDGEYQQVADVRGESEYHAKRPFAVTVVPAFLVR